MALGSQLEQAKALLMKATEQDNRKNYAEALRLYENGIEFILHSLKCNSQIDLIRFRRNFMSFIFALLDEALSQTDKKSIQAKCKQYLDRADMLKKHLRKLEERETPPLLSIVRPAVLTSAFILGLVFPEKRKEWHAIGQGLLAINELSEQI